MSKAGDFEIKVSGPYPCWMRLKYGGEYLPGSFSHKEIADLLHCVRMAAHEARMVLGKYRDEVPEWIVK